MKGITGRFINKLKFIPTICNLKQDLVLHLNPFPTHIQTSYKDHDHDHDQVIIKRLDSLFVDQAKVPNDDEEMEFMECEEDETNTTQSTDFDTISDDSCNDEARDQDIEDFDTSLSLAKFDEKCPLGGEESVIFYSTSLRSIRKTFEDCNRIRFLLQSFRVSFHERDVSMDLEFREELWRVLGGRVIPPKLFVKGRYIGGADEVVGLHESGKLKKILEGIPLKLSDVPCERCAGMQFLVCSTCNGNHKVFRNVGGSGELCGRCHECNENGLVKCIICT